MESQNKPQEKQKIEKGLGSTPVPDEPRKPKPDQGEKKNNEQ